MTGAKRCDQVLELIDACLAEIATVPPRPPRHKDPVERHPDEDLYRRLGWDR